ncbi:MAG: hypothetical protein IJS47_04310 [Clostridia bacterium]|nr:hypothetical protein [Clostridia bacterium]
MFCNNSFWAIKLISIALISFGIGLLIATIFQLGWFMIILAIISMVLGVIEIIGNN